MCTLSHSLHGVHNFMEDSSGVVAMTDDDGNGIGKFGSRAQSFYDIFFCFFVHLITRSSCELPTRDDMIRAEFKG